MINYLHPKSKKIAAGLSLSLLVLFSLVLGSVLLFQPIKPVISDQIQGLTDSSSQSDSADTAVAYLTDLHLPVNKLASAEVLPANPDPTEVNVKGASYSDTAVKQLTETKQSNRIVIPKMGVDAKIWEGNSADTLWKGVWHMPVGQTPDGNGNTVITAHRYWHRPPNPETFYNIHKMEIGDIITVYWNGDKYQYRVTETKIVEPTDVSILNDTATKQLTLFSCTPLFTSDKRLVVIAKPI